MTFPSASRHCAGDCATLGSKDPGLSAGFGAADAAYSRAGAASPRRRRLLRDDDAVPGEIDVAARGEVLEDPAHHLARGADAVGDRLLGEALAKLAPAVAERIGESARRRTTRA